MSISDRRTRLLRDLDEYRANASFDKLSLDRPGGSLPSAWFLGPKAENAGFLREMINLALNNAIEAREEYGEGDPRIPSALELERAGEVVGATLFRDRFDEVLQALKGSIPMSSYRNQSHMYWDTTLPSIVGYFATMLFNENNCTPEASPITTLLEMEVGDDLCRMLGYEIPDRETVRNGAIRPWGHITCDGSVANIESMWAARNIKYLPVALAAAIRQAPDIKAVRALTVRTLQNKRRVLIDLDSWTLLNLPIDEIIKLPRKLSQAAGFSPDKVKDLITRYSIQDLGLIEFHRRFLPDVPAPVTLAPATAHYSWHKAGSLLGIGRASVQSVRVDLDARMDPVHLRRLLHTCLDAGRPVMQVTAVIGSTEESAVDPLHEIVKIRDEFRELGMEFSLHADAAWGGYFASMLRPSRLERDLHDAKTDAEREAIERAMTCAWGVDNPDADPNVPDDTGIAFTRRAAQVAPGIDLNRYVKRQYQALCHCDTITVDPHKGGMIVYPAGALCYRNGNLRNIIAFASPVVAHGDIDQSVGFYGVEGSKPGASATAVYLSHSIIPADRAGYGALLGKCMFSSKRFYAALVSMTEPGDAFYVTPFQRLPAEKAGATRAEVLDQIAMIRQDIVNAKTNDDLLKRLSNDYEMRELFTEMGSDQCIVAYAFNYRTRTGQNRSLTRLNDMNERMFQAMSLQKFSEAGVPKVKMFVTSSSFDPEVYGQDFVDTYARRIGVTPEPGIGIKFLISTQQNPWMTSTVDGDFTPKIIDILRGIANDAAHYVSQRHSADHGEEHWGAYTSPVQGPVLHP